MTLLLSLYGCQGGCRPAPLEKTEMPAKPTIQLPGMSAHDADLAARLLAALTAQGTTYVPRTHHLKEGGAPEFVNRLILEASPYLLQHAHNPVNWFSWGPEAFALAAKLDRPILLSVGYSTCHWCHVMERESFEDLEIAAFINAHFIAIKVDREERPDVDSVYMTAVQMMTGRGGWPMTVVMTPDRRPYFGGTYFPARDGERGSRMGFLSILKRLSEAYQNERDDVLRSAANLSQKLAERSRPNPGTGIPEESTLAEAATFLAGRFDATYGGFGRAPKFPRPSVYELLLRYARRTGDKGALHMVTHSMAHMADGGIYDHIGGGFSRYSTDQHWLVPHFEKMLYDNAQLTVLAVETWQSSHQDRFSDVAKDTLNYVLKEMTSEGGGFYSATDADSDGEEGKFFVWTPEEIEAAVGPEAAKVVNAYWGVSAAGNFEGKNILNRARPEAEVAAELNMALPILREAIKDARAKLYNVRKKRIPPQLDDKILTEWNGQMISAMARAGFAVNEPKYTQAAVQAANFVLTKLSKDGRLLRAYRGAASRHGAVLEDYAFFIAGLLDLFEATGDVRWMDESLRLQKILETHHLDKEGGGFFATPDDGEVLLVREKPDYDGAQPSGNSVATLNLLRLHEFTQDLHYLELAQDTLRGFGGSLSNGASQAPKLAQALDWIYDAPKEILIVSTPSDDGAALKDVLRRSFVPNKVFVQSDEAQIEALTKRIPWLEAKVARNGQATAYVCKGQVCKQPTSDPSIFEKQLAEVEPLIAPPLSVAKP